MFRRLRAVDGTINKYKDKVYDSLLHRTRGYSLSEPPASSEPFVLEKDNGGVRFTGLYDRLVKRRQVAQRYAITRNDWQTRPEDYRNSVRAAIFCNYYELKSLVPKKWGRKWEITVEHSAVGKFEIKPGGTQVMTTFLDALLGGSKGYLPNGYITIRITVKHDDE